MPGDPVEQARHYDAAGADELVFLDIAATVEERDTLMEVVARTAEQCFMPLTVGGGVRRLEDIRRLLLAGADKVSINTAALDNPPLIGQAAQRFGAQCVTVAIDAIARPGGGWEAMAKGGRQSTGRDAVAWAAEAAARGAGEILLTSMEPMLVAASAGCKLFKSNRVGTLEGPLAFDVQSGLVDESDGGVIDIFLQDAPGICAEHPAAHAALSLRFPAGQTGVIRIEEASPTAPSAAVVWRRADVTGKFYHPFPERRRRGRAAPVHLSATSTAISGRFDVSLPELRHTGAARITVRTADVAAAAEVFAKLGLTDPAGEDDDHRGARRHGSPRSSARSSSTRASGCAA